MAVFILSIGIISTAALFPAGILQQQRGTDDLLGGIVADNAMATIRSVVSAEDFGSLWDLNVVFGVLPNDVQSNEDAIPFDAFAQRQDFPWLRPGFIFDEDDFNNPLHGAIDIFSSKFVRDVQSIGDTVDGSLLYTTEFPGGLATSSSLVLAGVPYNPLVAARENGNRDVPPQRIITRQERLYPQQSSAGAGGPERFDKPQYAWDCMFRRYAGRVQVAIFVYRIVPPPGYAEWVHFTPYRLSSSVSSSVYGVNQPSFPERLNLVTPPADANLGDQTTNWDLPTPSNGKTISPYVIDGVTNIDDFDMDNEFHTWTSAGQWLITQNNDVLNVVSSFAEDGGQRVELTRPPALLPNVAPNFFNPNAAGVFQGGFRFTGTVTHLWYLPKSMPYDIDNDNQPDFRVTVEPVYATIQEL